MVRGFDVCLSCVRSVECLLPALRGMFVRTDVKNGTEKRYVEFSSSSFLSLYQSGLNANRDIRICDMRFDSKRFIQYFDAMETASDNSLSFSEKPDIRPLAALAKRLAMFPECARDAELPNVRWHIIKELPEFTVCEECFDEVVWPEVRKRSALALMFKEGTVRLARSSCQLYSERMREVFKAAVERNDFVGLAKRVRERKAIEAGYRKEIGELKRMPGGEREIGRCVEEWRRWE